jgi:hypothetical protein
MGAAPCTKECAGCGTHTISWPGAGRVHGTCDAGEAGDPAAVPTPPGAGVGQWWTTSAVRGINGKQSTHAASANRTTPRVIATARRAGRVADRARNKVETAADPHASAICWAAFK